MNQRVLQGVVAAAMCGWLAMPVVLAEEPRAIPTLLIKGEVVSLDQNDPAAPLLKVKDRYGFETPIYLTPETKVTQGDQASTVESLGQGTAVEVEYNFDINTAKRHAVSVKLNQSADAAAPAASAPEAAPMMEESAPMTEEPAAGEMPEAPSEASEE